jgi:hypothetical protein
MTKINLFFILAFKEQTFAYEKIIKHENNLIKLNKKDMQTTLSWHYIMLSNCLLYTSPSPRDRQKSRMPSSA